MLKPLLLSLCLCLALVAGVQAAVEAPTTALAYRAQSRAALDELIAANPVAPVGDAARHLRDRAILEVVQAQSAGLREQTLEALADYREQHPEDLYAKLYEGYGWLFLAGEYNKRQNFFRAAELAKRGFFLMDEAVDQHPEDWRLHLLRARLDTHVPAEFGRHVVALKDLRVLAELGTPADLDGLLEYLRLRALEAAGQDEQALQARARLQATPLWAELLQLPDPRLFLTREEVQHLLAPILGVTHE
ncbi:MAG: hypothetical protein V4812_00735 [Pseudomonadota bacterium]